MDWIWPNKLQSLQACTKKMFALFGVCYQSDALQYFRTPTKPLSWETHSANRWDAPKLQHLSQSMIKSNHTTNTLKAEWTGLWRLASSTTFNWLSASQHPLLQEYWLSSQKNCSRYQWASQDSLKHRVLNYRNKLTSHLQKNCNGSSFD